MTTNHNYDTPAKGAKDWHVPLNDNFEELDGDVEIRDTEANKGNYDPKAGAKFLATDTERVYVGDGSTWTRLASTGTDPTVDSLNSTGSVLDVPTKVSVDADAGSTGAVHGHTATDRGAALYGEYANTSTYGYGVRGKADGDAGIGVQGQVDASRGYGVRGVNHADGGIGVQGRGTHSNGIGVSGQAPSGGWAGYFQGKCYVNGPLEATGSATLHGEATVGGPLRPQNDFLGVERSDSIGSGEVFGLRADTNTWGGTYVETTGTDGLPYYGYANDGSPSAYHWYDPSANEWKLSVDGNTVMSVDASGNLSALGNKNFVQTVDTDDGEKEVVYTAPESGTPHTQEYGVAELVDGRVEVDLPDHFAWVTDGDEPISVQVTPHADELVHPQVTERSTHRIVIEDPRDPAGSYEVSYTVTGTRDGHADKKVVREPRDVSTQEEQA